MMLGHPGGMSRVALSNRSIMQATYVISNFEIKKKKKIHDIKKNWRGTVEIIFDNIFSLIQMLLFQYVFNIKNLIGYFTFFFCTKSLKFGVDFLLIVHLSLN